MAINPNTFSAPGSIQGVVNDLADVKRRVSNLEAVRSTVGDGTITGTMIATGTILAANIFAGTITTELLAAGAVTTNILAAGSVTAGKIVAGTITANEIAAHTLTATQIAADTITATEIAASAITASEIAANTITANKLVAHTLTATEIAASTLTATEIAANTITASQIAASTITATQVATGTLTGNLLAGSTVTGDKLVADTITAREITGSTLSAVFADMGTLTAGKVMIGAAGAAKVGIGQGFSTSAGTKDGLIGTDSGNAVTFWLDPSTGNLQLKGTILSGSSGLGNITGQINGNTNVASGTVTGDRLVTNTITATQIAAGTITATEIAAVTITAGKIVTGTLTATQIATGTITATQIATSTITSTQIAANTITTTNLAADAIDAMTITGAIIQTAADGTFPRAVLNADGFTTLDATGAPSVVIPTDPAQSALFSGQVSASGGLILPASGLPTLVNKARWLKTDGSEASALYGVTTGYDGSSANASLYMSGRGTGTTYTGLLLAHSNIVHYWALANYNTPNPDSKGTLTLTPTNTVASSITTDVGLVAGSPKGLRFGQNGDKVLPQSDTGVHYYSGSPAGESATTGLTIEYWIKYSFYTGSGWTGPQADVAVVQRSSSAAGTHFWQSVLRTDNKLDFKIRKGGATTTSTSTSALTPGGVYHIMHTYDGANMKTYINGALDKTTAATGSIDAQTTNPFFIGKPTSGSRISLTLDDVSYYTAALTGTEVADHYSTGLTGSSGATTAEAMLFDSDGLSGLRWNAFGIDTQSGDVTTSSASVQDLGGPSVTFTLPEATVVNILMAWRERTNNASMFANTSLVVDGSSSTVLSNQPGTSMVQRINGSSTTYGGARVIPVYCAAGTHTIRFGYSSGGASPGTHWDQRTLVVY